MLCFSVQVADFELSLYDTQRAALGGAANECTRRS